MVEFIKIAQHKLASEKKNKNKIKNLTLWQCTCKGQSRFKNTFQGSS